MAFDAHSNFGYSYVAVAPVPANSGTSLQVGPGQGALFPAAPFNCTVWPAGVIPLASNAEIIRVTAIVGDTFTIVRAQEGTSAINIDAGFQISNTTSVKVFTDIENAIKISAGTQNFMGPFTFADGNGISWGMDNGTITGSVAPAAGGGVGISAGANSQSTGTVTFVNANGITFGLDGIGNLTASYTVPSTAGLISFVNFSAGTTSNNLTAITFSNSNGIGFGLNGGTLTASHNGLTSQSNQAASASNGSFTFQTLNFSDGNGVTFLTSAGGIIAASVDTARSIGLSGGTQSNLVTAIVFSNANGFVWGVNGSTVTLSNTAGGGGSINFSAGTTSNNLASITFSNANGISFGLDGGTITASFDPAGAPTRSFFQNEMPALTVSVFAANQLSSSFVGFNLPYNLSAAYARFGAVIATNQTTLSTLGSSMNASAEVYSTFWAIAYSLGTGASSNSLMTHAVGSAAWTLRHSLSVGADGTSGSYTQALTGVVGGTTHTFSTQYSLATTNYSFSSLNFLSNYSGTKQIDIIFNSSLAAGPYWMMFGFQSSSSANSARISAATQCRIDFASALGNRGTGNFLPVPMGQTSGAAIGMNNYGGAIFTSAAVGTKDAIDFNAVVGIASHPRILFQLINQS